LALEGFDQSREGFGTGFAAIRFGLESDLKRWGSQLFHESRDCGRIARFMRCIPARSARREAQKRHDQGEAEK